MAAAARADLPDSRSLAYTFERWRSTVRVLRNSREEPLGLIVSSFAAVSLQPPMVSFCASRDSLTWQRMRHAGRVAIHVLAARHGGFARREAPPGADRFAEPLREPLAIIECDLAAEHPAGDHSIVVGRVLDLHVSGEPDPLVYFDGGFGVFHPTEKEHPCP